MFRQFVKKHMTMKNYMVAVFASTGVGGGVGVGCGVALAAAQPETRFEYPFINIARGLRVNHSLHCRPESVMCIEYPIAGLMTGIAVGVCAATIGPIIAPFCGIAYGLQRLVRSDKNVSR
jgi:hypothetical protein